MTLLYIDGFDNFSQQSAGTGWSTNFTTVAPGRFGDGRYANSASMYRPVTPTSQPEIIVGVALKFSGHSGGFQFGSTSNNEALSIIYYNATGDLKIRRGSETGTILASSSTGLYSPLVWNYMEARVKLHSTAGSYAVRMNGVAVPGIPDATNVNTDPNGTNGNVASVWFRSFEAFSACQIDDLYIANTSGTTNNDFLGDVRVETLLPVADSSVQWTPTTTSNWQAVDEAPADDDTSYVSSSTVGQKDLYQLSDLNTTSGTILGVQADIRARKTDSGTRGVVAVLKSGATESDTTTYGTIAATYMYFRELREDKPGGTGWTIADVNSLLMGVKVSE